MKPTTNNLQSSIDTANILFGRAQENYLRLYEENKRIGEELADANEYMQEKLHELNQLTVKLPLFYRMTQLSDISLCNIWNNLTNPSKPRLETAHIAAKHAAQFIKDFLVNKRRVRLTELSNGMIFPAN